MGAESPKTPPGRRRMRRNGLPTGILVDKHIRLARKQHLLEIDPFDERLLEPATYDLRVGEHAAISTASRPINLSETGWLTIEPGAMAILESREVLKLSDQIAGRIGPKTALLRRGVLAATGPQIDPGFNGRLIVNLINLSPRTFSLRFEDPFLSIEFHYLSEAPERAYSGEYQGRMELSSEELEVLLAYQGPTLAEIYRGFADLRDNIRDIVRMRRDLTDALESGFADLRTTITHLSSLPGVAAAALSVSLHELGEEGYEVIRPIPVVVQRENGEFLASFFDANVHTTGATDQEAFDNLRSLILDIYDSLTMAPKSELAEPARRQYEVLKSYVRRCT